MADNKRWFLEDEKEKKYLEGSSEFWEEIIMECARSLSETQKLKAEILKDGLFSDPNEREEVLLLIDHILWEEIDGINAAREKRQENIVAISNLLKSIQERAG